MYNGSMIDYPNPPAGELISFRLDGALQEAVDRIARQDGCSRSEVLRRLLMANLQSEEQLTVRCVRRLRAIEGELTQMHELLGDAEAEDAAEFVEEAVDAVGRAVDELEEWEEEDD